MLDRCLARGGMKFAGRDEGSRKRSAEKFERSQLRLIAVLAVSSASRKCGPVTSLDATLDAATERRRLCRPFKWASPHPAALLPSFLPRTSSTYLARLRQTTKVTAVSSYVVVEWRRWRASLKIHPRRERAPNNGRLNEPLIIPSTQRRILFIESTRATITLIFRLLNFTRRGNNVIRNHASDSKISKIRFFEN